MSKHLTLFTLAFGVALFVGCSKSSADAANPEPTAAAASSQGTPRTLTVSGVRIDPKLASACGIVGVETFFAFDSAQVEGGDHSALTQLSTCLSTGPLKDQRVELVGHTDPRGSDEYNAKLGRSRAQSVGDFLVGRGVSDGNIAVSSGGEAGADPSDPAEWPFDRRVDVRMAP